MGYKTSENDYKVYAHINPVNGKMYIGCTKKPLSIRFDNGNGYKKCKRFWEDIIKYGFTNFVHILIADGMQREQAHTLEEELIKKYKTTDSRYGYNMRGGGPGVGEKYIVAEETKRHISEAKMGHSVSEETRAKLRQYGNKKVVQLSLDGFFVAEYPSLTEAAKRMNTAKTNISSVCRKKAKTCRGYVWVFATDWEGE